MSKSTFLAQPMYYSAAAKLKILREIDACNSPRIVRQILGVHNISTEELAGWREKLEDYGPLALRATRR